jgi:ribosomal protein L14
MVFKQTRVEVSDRSGAGRVRVVNPYYSWTRGFSISGGYVRAAVESLSRLPPRIRGRRYRPMRPGFVVRALVISSAMPRQAFSGVFSSAV